MYHLSVFAYPRTRRILLTPARNPTGPDAALARPLATVCAFGPISSVHDHRCHHKETLLDRAQGPLQVKSTRPDCLRELEDTKTKLE